MQNSLNLARVQKHTPVYNTETFDFVHIRASTAQFSNACIHCDADTPIMPKDSLLLDKFYRYKYLSDMVCFSNCWRQFETVDAYFIHRAASRTPLVCMHWR